MSNKEEDHSPAPAARFTRYLSRQGRKDAKTAKEEEGGQTPFLPLASFAFFAPLREELGIIFSFFFSFLQSKCKFAPYI